MTSATSSTVYFLCKLVGGIVAGTLCGMIPYYFGKQRRQPTLALAGLMACTLSGVVMGLILALPVAGIFCGVIALRSKPQQQTLVRLSDGTEECLSLELCEE